jgi:ammonia channel protein AmtB
MSHLLLKKITIYLTINERTIDSYFNAHDPAPLYKRQLSHRFEQYIYSSIVAIKRYSVIRYRLVCTKESDKEFIEPLMHAIRRHFSIQKAIKEEEFLKFKKRSFKLLFASLAIVMFCQGVLPALLNENHRVHSALSNALDVFSWVILWQPIDKLIFAWNPFLKEISVFDRLMNAETVLLETEADAASVVELERKYA